MIKQKFILNRRYWKIYVYYDVSSEDVDIILARLEQLQFPHSFITGAYTTIVSNKLNQGITQTNKHLRSSVIIITKTSSAEEFINSFVHEIAHVANHIANAYAIDLSSEEFCYIAGEIGERMYKACHKLMCNCCRKT